jgi:pilus assembly protein Flp/PilA
VYGTARPTYIKTISYPMPVAVGSWHESGRTHMQLANIRARLGREEGQALVEYALIVSLIAVVAIAALTLTGTNIISILSSIANNL